MVWSYFLGGHKERFYCIYFTSIEKQVLTTYTNLSQFCYLGTTPVLTPNMWASEKIPKLKPASGNRTRDLKIAWWTLPHDQGHQFFRTL